eukprot:163354-Pelagomonas_calceolata.AAC.5
MHHTVTLGPTSSTRLFLGGEEGPQHWLPRNSTHAGPRISATFFTSVGFHRGALLLSSWYFKQAHDSGA